MDVKNQETNFLSVKFFLRKNGGALRFFVFYVVCSLCHLHISQKRGKEAGLTAFSKEARLLEAEKP